MILPLPARAYDIEILHKPAERGASCQGWAFGLPPGIETSQWPLDPRSGFPLVHGFTLLLPEDYRCHGPEIVALSFFATAADQNDGGAPDNPEITAAVLCEGEEPSDPDLAVFWQAAKASHPRLHRMTDILNLGYAVILLTHDEFHGPLCEPPRLPPSNRWLAQGVPPKWLACGSGRAYFDFTGGSEGILPMEKRYTYKILGEAPAATHSWSRALIWAPRKEDPNAGRAPEEDYQDTGTRSGYQSPFYSVDDIIQQHAWTADHKRDHIGGTMMPIQGIPDMSPYYIGFEEYLGGYNFGTGNAQLDFLDMKIDWACG